MRRSSQQNVKRKVNEFHLELATCLTFSTDTGDNSSSAPHYDTISDTFHGHSRTIPKTTTDHQYHYICTNIYSKGEPEDLAKHKWYHGKVTREQADAALGIGNYDKFIVRHSCDTLILSRARVGRISHTIIQRSPKGYQLEGCSEVFDTIPDMITHYKQSLGSAVEKVPTGTLWLIANNWLLNNTTHNRYAVTRRYRRHLQRG